MDRVAGWCSVSNGLLAGGATLAMTARNLATEINEEHFAAHRAASSVVEHVLRCGALLIEAKAQGQHGGWLSWLAEHCPSISTRTAQAYMRLARRWPELEANAQRVALLPLRDVLKVLAGPREAHNSGDEEWFTPGEIADAGHRLMGGVDLDPASNAVANDVVRASRYYDRQADGLRQPWAGRVFLNPPYVNKVIAAFVDRLLDHVRRGDVTQAVVLTNNATETPWFQNLATEATVICFPLGRVHYWRADDRKLSSALQGQAILYFGERRDQFAEIFVPMGLLLRRDHR